MKFISLPNQTYQPQLLPSGCRIMLQDKIFYED